ncbi:MAG: sulfide/dihydroorotate dehydrogenase-like FAD/NAD-binding protein [Chloroflexi bacterium]|nr:sulfide/dihydroorotate dehydrogenase-like FAD/NAD-binding protein [Chloroflexota bacterium]
MYRVVSNQLLAPGIRLLTVIAPQVAAKAQPGQFIILRVDEKGERASFPLVDWDRSQGTVSFSFQERDRTTAKLAALTPGASVLNLMGPLGHPSAIGQHGQVLAVAEGMGIATLFGVARAFREVGSQVVALLGAAHDDGLFWQGRWQAISHQLVPVTENGSSGRQGSVAQELGKMLSSPEAGRPDVVVVRGSTPTMAEVCEVTRPLGIKTVVSIHSLMFDGFGICGGCRITVDGAVRLVCLDGPDFDGHKVDWEEIRRREMAYPPGLPMS